MPSVNITTDASRVKDIEKVYSGLAKIIANELTCLDRTLDKKDILIDTITRASSYQSSDTKIEIYAFPYEERSKRSDEISTNIKNYLFQNCLGAGSVNVFLYLVDLGYSVTK